VGKQAWEERVRNGKRRKVLKIETTLEKEDMPPQVQARLSVVQPNILINLSSITFSIYLPWLSVANPALLELFIHSPLLQERSPLFLISTTKIEAVCSRENYTPFTLYSVKNQQHYSVHTSTALLVQQ
jgi:hypothetical protein